MTDETPAPRLAPLPRDEWTDDVVDALRKAFPEPVVERFLAAPEGGGVPTAISTMLHHPALAGAWLSYNNVLLWSPAVEARLRELVVLRVAYRSRSNYEWVQHVKLAEERFGVTRDDVDAIADGVNAKRWTPLEHDLLAATDQLIDHARIDDDTWQRLAEQLNEKQLVELVFIVGTYTCLAMAFNSFGLQLDAGLDTSEIPPLPD